MKKNQLLGKLIMVFLMAVVANVYAVLIMGCNEPDPPPPECEADEDCPEGKACEGGRCLRRLPPPPPPPECVRDSDCSDNKVCRGGECKIECTDNSGCGENEECVENRCQEVQECEIQRIHFDFDEFYLTSEAQNLIRQNYECLREKEIAKIKIEGHCDERGSTEYNLSLGQKRAQAVKKFLQDLGFDRTKIKVVSYGEERPLETGSDEFSWSKNRRGETVPNQ